MVSVEEELLAEDTVLEAAPGNYVQRNTFFLVFSNVLPSNYLTFSDFYIFASFSFPVLKFFFLTQFIFISLHLSTLIFEE